MSLKKVAFELRHYHLNHNPAMIPCERIMISQMVHESGHGKSDLAKRHNYAGMKWRKELAMLDGVFPEEYSDWEGKKELYVSCRSEKCFVGAYHKFLSRKVYKKNGKTPFDFADDPAGFLRHIVECGWCGSTPSIKRENFPAGAHGTRLYKRARNDAYIRSIWKLHDSRSVGLIYKATVPDVYDAEQMPAWLRV